MMNISMRFRALLAVIVITATTSVTSTSAFGATGSTTQNAPVPISSTLDETGEQVDVYQVQLTPGSSPISIFQNNFGMHLVHERHSTCEQRGLLKCTR